MIGQFPIEYSFHGFAVYDSGVRLPGNESTDDHFNQGFARRDSSVNFVTLSQFGRAQVQVFANDYVFDEADERVIKVPFFCPSGKVFVEGPEENSPHSLSIEPGHYQLTAAQQAKGEESLSIRLYFEKVDTPIVKSEILVKDEALNPPAELVETAEIAGF